MTTTCILKNAHVMPECDLKDHAMLPLVIAESFRPVKIPIALPFLKAKSQFR